MEKCENCVLTEKRSAEWVRDIRKRCEDTIEVVKEIYRPEAKNVLLYIECEQLKNELKESQHVIEQQSKIIAELRASDPTD